MNGFDPSAFAAGWMAAWNARDLDAVLAHFHDDATFSSPLAERLGHGVDGTVSGKAAIRDYWRTALALNPHLHFTIDGVLAGCDVVVIRFTLQDGTRRAEILEFAHGLVRRGHGTDEVGP